ncbi:hypothetical protein CI102_14441 [Trichoderma harzianum]|nr:hypothetical protein CI102_14441 [Trichoderma harzianum]
MSSTHAIESNIIGNDAWIHQGNVIHNYASAPREFCVLIPFFYNEELIHRQDIINELDRILPLSDEYSTAALYGLGGSGKTQIALDYAYRRNVVGEDLLIAVRYDTADNLRLFAYMLNLDKFIPRGLKGQALWTSCDKRIAGGLVAVRRVINIPKMTPNEAKELFDSVRNNRVGNDEGRYVVALLDELKWLLLAISQATVYIRRTLIIVEEYAENKMVYQILHIHAYLDNQNIPIELVKQAAHYSNNSNGIDHSFETRNDNSSSVSDSEDDKVTEAIARLCDFSFLSIQMHKLVQEAMRWGLSRKERKSEANYFSAAALGITYDLFPRSPYEEREAWNQCEKYITHTQQACEWAALCGGDEKAVELLSRLAHYLSWQAEVMQIEIHRQRREILGDINPYTIMSEEIMVRALALLQGIIGTTHHITVRTMANLVAEEMIMEVLTLQQNILGHKHLFTITTMANISAIHQSFGRYQEAETLGVEVLALRREMLGDQDPDTIKAMARLGKTYRAAGKYKEAEEILVKALALRREVLGDEHPDTMKIIKRLAYTRRQLERLSIEEN